MSLKLWSRSCAASALALALASPVAVLAQETTSSIRGAISGPSGPVAGATVTIVHAPSGTRSTATTNAGGDFAASGLRVGGPYTLQIVAPGFQSETIEGLFLTLGEPFRFTRELAPVRQQAAVVVTATALAGAADTIGSANNFRRDTIESVVSVTRDIRDIARRDPLVSQDIGGGLAIGGSNARTNRITVDGVQAQDDFGLNTGGLPTSRGPISLEAVEQFAVEVVPFDPSNGDFTGGGLNLVMRSGGNRFEGSLFANYLNEGLVGQRIRSANSRTIESQTNWGAFLSGPIIPDRLFFSAYYETYESLNVTGTGPAGQGFAQTINGVATGTQLAQTDIDNVLTIFRNNYAQRYEAGAIPLFKPVTDEKYGARIDWNITDKHRAAFTYRFTEDASFIRTDLGQSVAALDSRWYVLGNTDESYSLQINSDWTQNFSTEVRLSKRDYARIQMPPLGQNFADVRICLSPTSLGTSAADRTSCGTVPQVFFGPDQFRHANELFTTNTQAQVGGTYIWGDHTIKAGFQYQLQEIFNLFVPQSDGIYYFDSVADFAAGRANQLQYRNALTGNARDAAANFQYEVYSLYASDTWDVTDALTVNYGVRYDWYASDKPAANPNFAARYAGRTNQVTYDGLDVIMPRLSFKYRPNRTWDLSGGIGLFSGGLPDVFISNVFSNTGILDNTITIRRIADTGATQFEETTGTPGFTQDLGALALNLNRANATLFSQVPAAVQNFLSGGGRNAPAASETNILARDFEMPSDWKVNLSGRYNWRGFELGADLLYTRNQEALAFRDIRAQRLVVGGVAQTLPDGRIRYDGLTTTAANRAALGITSVNPGANRDIEAYNPGQEGETWFAAFSVAKEWDNGIDFSLAHTFGQQEDFSASARFASTASSLYGDQTAALDPNTSVFGTSNEEIRNNTKLALGWRKAFVGNLETRFSLFGEVRSGRPWAFSMGGGGGRNAVFGVNRGSQLAYIPDFNAPITTLADGTVNITGDIASFNNITTYNTMRAVAQRYGLGRGIMQKGQLENPDVARVDLQISQELPAVLDRGRFLLTFDIRNVLNLISSEWGVVEEWGTNTNLADVRCADANGVEVSAALPTCVRYRFSNVPAAVANNQPTLNSGLSRWFIQIGLKYEF